MFTIAPPVKEESVFRLRIVMTETTNSRIIAIQNHLWGNSWWEYEPLFLVISVQLKELQYINLMSSDVAQDVKFILWISWHETMGQLIGLDIDDVLGDFVGSLVTEVNIHFGTQYKREDITPYYKQWRRLFGAEGEEWIWSMFDDEKFVLNIHPTPGAV